MDNEAEGRASDYTMSTADANQLKGTVLLPMDIRVQALTMYSITHGHEALVKLFANFIGLANQVVANTRDAAELLMIIHGDIGPYEAEKINMPSLFGALHGVELANSVDQRKTCDGCAFRLGTLANQSPSTTSDVLYCLEGDDKFMCHEHFDGAGNPTRPCGGHAQILARQASV